MKLYLSKDSRVIDEYAIKNIGVPSIILMEHAARGVYEEIKKRFSPVKNRKFVVLYGSGNNGGDALCVARYLLLDGAKVIISEVVARPKTPDAQLEMEFLLKTAKGRRDFTKLDAKNVIKKIDKDTVVIDGVFGTGFRAAGKGTINKKLQKLFEAAGSAGFVLSIDVPSGVDADTGEVSEHSIVADCTVTFCLPKVGLFISPGSLYSGEVIVKELFVPKKEKNTPYEFVDEELAKNIAKGLKRRPDSHKGSYGHVAVVSPSKGMEGAVAMCVRAAMKSGAGLVSVLAVGEKEEFLRKRMPMLMSEAMIKEYMAKTLSSFSVVVVGPGFGKERKKDLKDILSKVKVPIVIDADALNIIAGDKKLLNILKKKDAVLTPHPGEMARLTGRKDVQEHRLSVLEKYVKGARFSVLLKGYRSMLGSGDGSIFINSTGNPALSKGGSGDVLSGIIAGFIAQGLSTKEAGILGAYVHGLCADVLVNKKKASSLGVLPTDIIKELGNVLRCLTE